MGQVCLSEMPGKDETTRRIDTVSQKMKSDFKDQVKILLLGPGESGKSTIFKQMKILQDHGGFSDEELLRFKQLLLLNCITQMKQLLEAAIELRQKFERKESLAYATKVLTSQNAQWEVVGPMIKELWEDKGVKAVFCRIKKDKNFPLNDSAEYFFDSLDRYLLPDFKPNSDDVLRVRIKTTSIEEAAFTFDKRVFRVVDVGGQRAERRKWIHCFDNITAVLYCASLAGYDLPVKEDPRQNQLSEALLLFDEVINSDNFKDKSVIFFLNKTDLFQKKLSESPLSAVFPGYTDGADYDKACQYVKERFTERINWKRRTTDTVFIHFTCALDTRKIEVVIKAVRVKLLNWILNETGLDNY